MTATSTRGAEVKKTSTPLWVPAAWIFLAVALLPLGIDVGLPFQVSPADALLPLIAPVVLFGLPRPKIFRLLFALVAGSLVIVLGWGLIDNSGGITEIQSWLFFWKSWVALLLAYGLATRSDNPPRAAARLIDFAVLAQLVTISMVLAGWITQGSLTARSGTGGLGFTAGLWSYPVQLYGYGQVNVTASLLALAGPLFAYRASRSPNIFVKLFWVSWIATSWWIIINSGSRGALVTAGLFLALLPLASSRKSGRISVGKAAFSLTLAAIIVTQAQVIIDASPKYAQTLDHLASGDTASAASGRTQINALAIEDITRSPVFGTAFGDFARFHTEADTNWVNSSPHNAYLGPIHKMGIPLGLGYLVLLWLSLPLRGNRDKKGFEYLGPPFALSVALGILPVGDGLTTPVLAATILTICGALLALEQTDRD